MQRKNIKSCSGFIFATPFKFSLQPIYYCVETAYESVAQQIHERSFAVVDQVLAYSVLQELVHEAMEAYIEGAFRRAEVGKGIEKQRVSELRSDRVKWLNPNNASVAQSEYWKFLEQLQSYLSDYFRIHLERMELHFAAYPKGAFYSPHLDQFKGHSNRIFSVVLYLNETWKKGDGGELRIYHSNKDYQDIDPILGRLICFRSDVVLHEVLAAQRMRLSLTGWMRRDPLIL